MTEETVYTLLVGPNKIGKLVTKVRKMEPTELTHEPSSANTKSAPESPKPQEDSKEEKKAKIETLASLMRHSCTEWPVASKNAAFVKYIQQLDNGIKFPRFPVAIKMSAKFQNDGCIIKSQDEFVYLEPESIRALLRACPKDRMNEDGSFFLGTYGPGKEQQEFFIL